MASSNYFHPCSDCTDNSFQEENVKLNGCWKNLSASERKAENEHNIDGFFSFPLLLFGSFGRRRVPLRKSSFLLLLTSDEQIIERGISFFLVVIGMRFFLHLCLFGEHHRMTHFRHTVDDHFCLCAQWMP